MLFEYTLIAGVLIAAAGLFRTVALMFTRTNPLTGFLVVAIGVGLVFYASTLKDSPLQMTDFANSVYKVVGRYN